MATGKTQSALKKFVKGHKSPAVEVAAAVERERRARLIPKPDHIIASVHRIRGKSSYRVSADFYLWNRERREYDSFRTRLGTITDDGHYFVSTTKHGGLRYYTNPLPAAYDLIVEFQNVHHKYSSLRLG